MRWLSRGRQRRANGRANRLGQATLSDLATPEGWLIMAAMMLVANRRELSAITSPPAQRVLRRDCGGRDGATRLIESRIVLELQSARGIRSAYGL